MKNKEEIEFIEDNLLLDNDASASIFGFEFQIDAGIYLFCEFYKEAKSFIIESALQDIEIIKNDNIKILCQAKSAQNPNGNVNHSNKLHDAILSLSRNSVKCCDNYIYVTNFSNPFGTIMESQFNEKMVKFDELNDKAKKAIINKVNDVVKEMERKEQKSESNKHRDVIVTIKNKVKNFDVNKLKIISIPRYFGEDNRFSAIESKLAYLLVKEFNINVSKADLVSKKAFDYLHRTGTMSSTIKDEVSVNNKRKVITREDFCWPLIVANNMSNSSSSIEKYMNGEFDGELENYIDMYNLDIYANYSYEFVNTIINDYNNYRCKAGNRMDNFINDKWGDYKDYFPSSEDQIKNKGLTVYYLYCILNDLSFAKNILRGKEL